MPCTVWTASGITRGTPVASVQDVGGRKRFIWPTTKASLSVPARDWCIGHVQPVRPRSCSLGALLPKACHEHAGRPRGHSPERRAFRPPFAALRPQRRPDGALG